MMNVCITVRKTLLSALALSLCVAAAVGAEPQVIPLWENGAPGEPATKLEHEPLLTGIFAIGFRSIGIVIPR